jgi:hypothetical protein
MTFDEMIRIIENGIYGEDIRTAIRDALLYLNEHGGGSSEGAVTSSSITDIEVMTYSDYSNMMEHDRSTLYLVYGDTASDGKVNAVLLDSQYSQTSTIIKTDTLEEMKDILSSKSASERWYVIIGEDAGVADISSYALSNLSVIYRIRIPSTCTTIALTAFSGDTNLSVIEINGIEGSISGSPWGAVNATVSWLISE